MGLISFLKEKFSKKNSSVEKYNSGMEKSRSYFSNKLNNISHKYKSVNEDYFEDLEELLIESDIGVNYSLKIIDEVLNECKKNKITKPDDINTIVFDKLFEGYISKGDVNNDLVFKDGKPTILLMVGVNGVGKTTTIAKIANRYLKENRKILLVAADTFRAGAKEQLSVWADRLGIDIVVGKDNADPASVAYDGVYKARKDKYDLVIVDTAGRLQNKSYLMDELSKIKRVLLKDDNESILETFLVIDATTGQNGVQQAKSFKEVTDLTGVVITKMDGTSKGGIILSIREELGIPVRFIGLGEHMDDLEIFDINKYLYGLCIGE